jgi:hypothetical protein
MNFRLFKMPDWLRMRSPKDASTTDVQYPQNKVPDVATDNIPQDLFSETHIKTDAIVGTALRFIGVEKTQEEPGDKMTSSHDRMSILVGCGHVITQIQAVNQKDRHIRGIGGRCVYCFEELRPLIEHGQITPFDLDRLSCVCSDCVRTTVSGKVACPKHCKPVLTPDGGTVYLGPEEIEEENRRATIEMVLGSLRSLFCEPPPPQLSDIVQEQKKPPIVNTIHGQVQMFFGDRNQNQYKNPGDSNE